MRLSPETFNEIIVEYPEVMQLIAKIVVQRLRAKERTASRAGLKKCIAVLASRPEMATNDFCERLVKALQHIGSTLICLRNESTRCSTNRVSRRRTVNTPQAFV